MKKDVKHKIMSASFDYYDKDSYDNIKTWIADANEIELDDITDDMIYQYIMDDIEIEYEDFISNMITLLSNTEALMVGYAQRWNGRFKGGTFIKNINDLQDFLGEYDDVSIYDINGHLYLDCYHHDGTDSMELKLLTNKGRDYARQHDFDHDSKLHEVIFGINIYSKLPKYYDTFYV